MTTTVTLTAPAAEATGRCPDCDGTFETCTCTGIAQRLSFLAPRAGIDDIGREDDQSGHDGSGYERDETDTGFHQVVRQLVVDGDTRARSMRPPGPPHPRRDDAGLPPPAGPAPDPLPADAGCGGFVPGVRPVVVQGE